MSAKPRAWWFWGETVITDNGITKDLEALKRVGFGGVVIYEQVFTDRPDAYKSLSPQWLQKVRFAAKECARLHLSLEVNMSSGYVAGGPWISPELGMQRLVFSELTIQGGKKFSALLPQPPTKLNYYKDVAVLAYPAIAGNEVGQLEPKHSSVPDTIDLATLFDVNSGKRIAIAPENQPVLIQSDYGQPCTIRSVSYSVRSPLKALVIATQMPKIWSDTFYGQGMRPIPDIGKLESSADGIHWDSVCALSSLGYLHDSWYRQTLSFPAVTARFFRFNLKNWGSDQNEKLSLGGIQLHEEALIDQWEKKSGNVVDFANPDKTPPYKSGEVIHPATIIDLTDKLDSTGHLNWEAPPGNWTILRFGHTPTGVKTKHGRPETMGLECDKLSARAATVQFENYVGRIVKKVQGVKGAKLKGVHMDSGEHGSQNWTDDFAKQFLQRRGYDMLRFLPAMAGKVVASPEQSDHFLFDVRRTIADLMSNVYFGTMQQLCHAQGMTLTAQAPGIATCLPSDNIQAKGRTDVPMGEFWMSQPDGTIDCKEAASAAHVYGLPVVAAESFTGSGADAHPAMMKPLADAALAQGINSFVVLASVHQPWDDRKPGVTEDRFYLPYQRHNTWWEYSTGFWTTLARSSYLMQQGQPVIDILYHLGNETPLKISTSRMRPIPPAGYDYDVCSDEILLKAYVKNGRILLPGGMSYRLLVLADGLQLTLAAALHIQRLITDGATVMSMAKPKGSPSLADGAAGSQKVGEIADALWGTGPAAEKGQRTVGKGELIWGQPFEKVLADLNLWKDFEVEGSSSKTEVVFAHRHTAAREIYFLANHNPEPVSFTGVFRTQGLIPQAWDPETGKITALTGYSLHNSRINIPLTLETNSSLFVVFGKGAVAQKHSSELVERQVVYKDLSKDWKLSFEPNRGAPENAYFSTLQSWSDHADSTVQQFSGTATYIKEFALNSTPKGKVILDLGRVEVAASVWLNGKEIGTAWKRPYAFDVTAALQKGSNKLEIKVANLWTNRLIADAALPQEKKLSWATFNPYKAGSAYVPSGLVGPVLLRTGK